jgi:hypothetical protein
MNDQQEQKITPGAEDEDFDPDAITPLDQGAPNPYEQPGFSGKQDDEVDDD